MNRYMEFQTHPLHGPFLGPPPSARLGWSIALLLTCALGMACGSSDVKDAAPGAGDATPRPAPAAADPATPARPRIVALGDSLTAGYGLVERQSYPSLLQDRLDAEGYKF